MTFQKSKFLVICGQQKAGTTSLFTWLSAHPDVCPPMYKNARIFLVHNYLSDRTVIAGGIPLHGKGVYPTVIAMSVSCPFK